MKGHEDGARSESRGLAGRVRRRLAWYAKRLKMDNEMVGTLVRLTGNRVSIDGVKVSVDNPLIQNGHKSTMYFGIYEEPERRLLKKYLRADDSVVELGGSIGVVSCIANGMLKDRTRHVVVEANPMLIPTLERNRDLNGAGFRLVNAAIAYGDSRVRFSPEGHFLMGHVGGGAADGVEVTACSLSKLLREVEGDDLVLLCDIEGAEIDMVRRDVEVIASRFRLIVMETHPGVVGGEVNSEMLVRLGSAGFRLVEKDVDVVVLERKRGAELV